MAVSLSAVIARNADTFSKLRFFSIALFVCSLGSFYAVVQTPVGGAPAGARARVDCAVGLAMRMCAAGGSLYTGIVICGLLSLMAARGAASDVAGGLVARARACTRLHVRILLRSVC